MGVRLNRTLLNWRWWVVLPIAAPVLVVSAVLAGNARLWHLVSSVAHSASKDADRMLSAVASPAMKWAREDWH